MGARLSFVQEDFRNADLWEEFLDNLDLLTGSDELGPEIVVLDATVDKVEY